MASGMSGRIPDDPGGEQRGAVWGVLAAGEGRPLTYRNPFHFPKTISR